MVRTIGVVGIGNMGWPMARRLVEAGFAVTVADANPDRVRDFVAKVGGQAAADAGQESDAVITMLPTSAHVAEALTATTLRPGCVVIEMSSGSPSLTRQLAATLHERGVRIVDCPVSGGVGRAETGELSIMAGGDADALAEVDPVLRVLGTTVHHCGELGAGQAMKALNNLVSAGGFLIGVEALLIGRRLGLDGERMVEVLNSSSGMNDATQRKLRQFVLSGSFDSGFSLDLMAKDLRNAVTMADEAEVVAPFAERCEALWAEALVDLGPGRDHTEMARRSAAVTGEELP